VAWFVAWLLAHRLSLWFWDITIIKQRARARFQLWLFLFLDSSLLVIYALQVSLSVEARSNDGHADFIAQVVIDDGTEDEVDVFVSLFLNHDRCLVNFLQTQIGTTGNGKQNALGAFHAGFQQWRINSLFCRLHHAVITACRAYAHQRRTSIRHNRAHVGKVDVDHAWDKNQVGNTLDTIVQDRKSTRLNSSHVSISYAVFCLKKKKSKIIHTS